MNARSAIGGRGSFEKNKRALGGRLLKRLLENTFLVPKFQDFDSSCEKFIMLRGYQWWVEKSMRKMYSEIKLCYEDTNKNSTKAGSKGHVHQTPARSGSFTICRNRPLGEDQEGEYRPEFVAKTLKASQEPVVGQFKSAKSFLRLIQT